jgi:hypothetical protein
MEVSSSSDIATQLGITPDNIYAVIGLVAAQGDSATINVRVSDDGTTFTGGNNLVLGASTGFEVVPADVRPSDSADWAGSDTITSRVQVI